MKRKQAKEEETGGGEISEDEPSDEAPTMHMSELEMEEEGDRDIPDLVRGSTLGSAQEEVVFSVVSTDDPKDEERKRGATVQDKDVALERTRDSLECLEQEKQEATIQAPKKDAPVPLAEEQEIQSLPPVEEPKTKRRSSSDESDTDSWHREGLQKLLVPRGVSQAVTDTMPPTATSPTSSLLAAAIPPSLHREQEVLPDGHPGAFLEAPGRDAVGREKAHIHDKDLQEHPPHDQDVSASLTFGVSTTQGNDEPDLEAAPQILSGVGDSVLIEALPVMDDSGSQAVSTGTATPVQHTEEEELAAKKRKLQQLTALIVGVGVLLLVGIILLNFFAVKEKQDPTLIMISATTAPTMAPTIRLILGLPDHSEQAILLDPYSPQAKANKWMLDDPNWQTYQPDRLLQRFALATFYYATTVTLDENGTATTTVSHWINDLNWLSYSHHECDWFSKPEASWGEHKLTSDSPCNANGVYERIWLAGNGLVGFLSEELYELSWLTSMDIQSNGGLGGSIASHIGTLSNLQHFAGPTSKSFGGALPTELGLLSSLLTMQLTFTRVSGAVPSQMGRLNKLERLRMAFNELSGPLPTELGLMTSLREIDLIVNQLSGPIPPEMARLYEKMMYFRLSDNMLTGSIPHELGSFATVYEFRLSDNMLTGTVPTNLGMMRELRELDVRWNTLTGTIPTQFGLWKHLFGLYLGENFFTEIPSQVGLMTSLTSSWLNDNPLTAIPSELGLLTDQSELNLGHTNTQLIPTEFGLLTNLVLLDLSHNGIRSLPILQEENSQHSLLLI